MTYKETLISLMSELSKDPQRVFIGYNVKYGKAGGTLEGVPEAQLIETPVAENLMMGMGIGMALAGWKPVVFFERFDFILNAMDAIVNHLDKIALLSSDEFRPSVLIRVVVGGRRKPLFTGPTHTQDLSAGVRAMVNFPVIQLHAQNLMKDWRRAMESNRSALLVEYRDLYDTEV